MTNPCAIPGSPEYPVVANLQTGEPLLSTEFERLAGLINWSIAYCGAGAVVSQGFHEDEVTLFGTLSDQMAWRIPTLGPQFTRVWVEVEVTSTADDVDMVFTSSTSSLTISIGTGRTYNSGYLTVDPSGTYEQIELSSVDTNGGLLDLHSIQIRYDELSDLAHEDHGHDGEVLWPLDVLDEPLPAAEEPLSTALGKVLKQDLAALLARPEVHFNHSGPKGEHIRCFDHPEQFPVSVVYLTPGAAEGGGVWHIHAKLKPHATETTWFRLLVEGSVFHAVEVDPAPAQAPFWIFVIKPAPELTMHLEGLRPAAAVGIWDEVLGVSTGWDGTNCGVMSLAVWAR